MTNKKPRVVAVIPCYNTAPHIAEVVTNTLPYVNQVIVVDDGSTDDTILEARKSGALVLTHDKNRGKGAAMKYGAQHDRADILVFIDGDGQHNPSEIPRLLEPIYTNQADLVIGCRRTQSHKTPFYRRIGQEILVFMSHILSGKRVDDSECGFRAISQKAILELELREKGYAIEAEMIARAVENKLIITQVPVSNIYHDHSFTLHSLEHGFGVLLRIVIMIIKKKPYLLLWAILSIMVAVLIINVLVS